MPEQKGKYSAADVAEVNGKPIGKYTASDVDTAAADVPQEAQPSFLDKARNFGKNVSDVENDLAIGALKGAGQTTHGISSLIHAIPGIGPKIIPQQGLDAFQGIAAPTNTAQKIGKYGEQAGEFLLPGVGEEKAASLLPKIPRIAKYATAALGSGALSTLQSDKPSGSDFASGAGAGVVGKGMGDAAQKIAPTIARMGLGIPKRVMKYGADPGSAILNETSAIRPGKIADQATQRIGQLDSDLLRTTANSPAKVDLSPARRVVLGDIGEARNRNSLSTVRDLGKISNQLNSDITTGAQIPSRVPADKALALRRGLDDEVRTWNPINASAVDSTVKGARHQIGEGLHLAVPETAPIDKRISSLIPVQKAGENKEFSAGILERGIGRLAKHTGALVGGVYGANEGYKHGGIGGAALGAGAGILVPEAAASPEAMTLAARAFHSPVTPAIGGAVRKPLSDILKKLNSE